MLVFRIKRKLIAVTIFFLFLLAALLFYADVSKVGERLASFNWPLLPVILTLTLLDDVLRFVKWDRFLKIIEVDLSRKESASIFFSGLAMAITPGKLGEALKAYLVRRRTGQAMSKTLPVVVIERLTDLIAVAILASVGAAYFQYGISALVVVALLVLSFILIVQRRKVCLWLIDKIVVLPFTKKFSTTVRLFYESAFQLLKLRQLAWAIAISIVAWGSECLALYLIYIGLGHAQSLLLSSFVFSFSSIIGGISMLPGGLGIAEVSMTGIMAVVGMERSIAVSAMLLIRFCTLWFGVLVGLVVLTCNRKKFELSKFEGASCQE